MAIGINRKKDKSKRIGITIVGAGHYGRHLALPKYLENDKCFIKGVISPTINKHIFAESGIPQSKLVRTIEDWFTIHGMPSSFDVFDLAVHCHLLPELVGDLAAIGAKNFIFPKPVALIEKDLDSIQRLKAKYNLHILIASQWYYSRQVSALSCILNTLRKTNCLEKAVLDFSQSFNVRQLDNYSATNALLPHMLQIIYSSGLCNFNKGIKTKIVQRSHTGMELRIIKSNIPQITIITNLTYPEKKRIMMVYDKKSTEPLLVADFMGNEPTNGPIKHKINWAEMELTITEDNLKTMYDRMLSSFLLGKSFNHPVLTFEDYAPIMHQQIEIEKAIQKPIR